MKENTKTILYVDDDPDDREFLSDAIRKVNPDVQVVVAENGVEALDYLHAIRDGVDCLPCMIILDINMPYLNGKETTDRIKSDPLLCNIPIVIFSSSLNPNDKRLFNELGIEFISKPDNISYMGKIASRMLGNCT